MKGLKIVGGLIIALVLAILIIAIFAPSENNLERTVVIDAEADQVRPYINSFESMLKWSPWNERDPNQTYTIEDDGKVGALYTWDGADSLVGAGSQTITKLEENSVVTHLHFIRPFESEADATTTLEEVEEGTKVTWSYHDETPYPFNIMNLMLDMEKMLGPDFQTGMDKLKVLVESESSKEKESSAYMIETIDMEPRVYVGKRSVVAWLDMTDYFEQWLPASFAAAQEAGLEITGMPSAIYFNWDEENHQADMLAGIPVKSGALDGMDMIEVGGRSLLINYTGSYDDLGTAHLAMESYFESNEIEPAGPAIEEYVTDPALEPDTTKWLTKIYYPIK